MPLNLESLSAALSDRFALEREIGAGGWAVVYLARDLKHQRPVAIKVLRPDIAQALGGSRFLREIEVVAQLRHPHILPLHDSGAVDGIPYYVMPYVEGESLKERLRREGPLPIDESVRIAQEIAGALAYAHSHGVIHRDIKPGNILIDSGHAVVADFGIAQVRKTIEEDSLTGTGLAPGTPKYMSPEQLTGDHPVDERADVYAIACVLYEMLTGEAPYAGDSVRAMIARKLVETPPALTLLREGVPRDLEPVVDRGLARVPADRFPSAEAFAKELDQAARKAGLGGIRRRSVTEWLLVGATTVVATLIGLSALGFVSSRAFDYKVAVPSEIRPLRGDYLGVGLQAMIPVLIWGGVGLIVYRVGRFLLARLAGLAPHLPGAGGWIRSRETEFTGAVRTASRTVRPTTVADAFLILTAAVTLLVLVFYWDLLKVIALPQTEILACSNRELHRHFQAGVPVIITLLLFAWVAVFRWVRSRAGSESRYQLARWASLACIIFLIFSAAVPWRLLYDSSYNRVRIDGERAYLLAETEDTRYAYLPDRRLTVPFARDAPIERLGIEGYVFEEPEVFESGQRECLSVTGVVD